MKIDLDDDKAALLCELLRDQGAVRKALKNVTSGMGGGGDVTELQGLLADATGNSGDEAVDEMDADLSPSERTEARGLEIPAEDMGEAKLEAAKFAKSCVQGELLRYSRGGQRSYAADRPRGGEVTQSLIALAERVAEKTGCSVGVAMSAIARSRLKR